MKNMLITLLIVSLSLLSSCSKDGLNIKKEYIVGKWQVVGVWNAIDGWMYNNGNGRIYIFSREGLVSRSNRTCVGLYTIDDDLEYDLTMEYDCQGSEYTINCSTRIEDGFLILGANPDIGADEGYAEKLIRITDD